MIINRNNARHYVWGANCDGWELLPDPTLHVIEERMPSQASEVRHHHGAARQFFYVLNGQLCMEVDGATHVLNASDGIEIPAGAPHRAYNESGRDVVFLVMSSPTTRGDRFDHSA
jgi:quercetin dioxygenase-like cupin family protein